MNGKKAVKLLTILICGPFLGLCALLLVHLLPVDAMKEHVYWSLEMIEGEFSDEEVIPGFPATLTGNFTDCLMLEYAVYSAEDHNVLEQVLHMYRKESCYDENDEEAWWPGRSLVDYLEGTRQPREVEYPRYWHGYLLILKPLLMLTSVNALRLINSACQLILTGIVLMIMVRTKKDSLAFSFLISLPFLFFVSNFSSLSLSICFYLMLGVVIVQLKYDEKFMEKDLYTEFFLIVGMSTSYFDFLTYPLITLGYPLCIYCYSRLYNSCNTSKFRFLRYSFDWGVGYAGMWMGKWILADMLSGSRVIKDAFNTIFIRTQSAEGGSRLKGFADVAGRNIGMYGNWCFVLVGAAGVLFLIHLFIKKRYFFVGPELIPFAVIAFYPLIWYFILENHSVQHWLYTCRILALSVFAVLTMGAVIVEYPGKRGKNSDESYHT